jgi:glyoxylase-like metal-dependent hydrolase (beta-lactamase superfamily II)
MPRHVSQAPDWCNAVIYLAGDHLYLIDSSGGARMRASIVRVLREVGPVEVFTLINTHSHLDHICNNDLIDSVEAKTKHHYLLRAGMDPARLNAPAYFADQFDRMDAYVDPFTSYPVNRVTYRIAGWVRDALGLFVGRRRVLQWLFAIQFRKFAPVADSRLTMEALDDRPAGPLRIGDTAWSGWRLGTADLYVLEARAHTDHDLLVYLPEHHMLCMGDVTFPLFPTWADSSRDRILECLRKSQAMAASSDVELLADGHGDRCYQGPAEVEDLLVGLVDDHMAYEQVLDDVFATADGLAPPRSTPASASTVTTRLWRGTWPWSFRACRPACRT